MKYTVLKRLLCKHSSTSILDWHWTHLGGMGSHIIEMRVVCNNCGKQLMRYIEDQDKCNEFVEKYREGSII